MAIRQFESKYQHNLPTLFFKFIRGTSVQKCVRHGCQTVAFHAILKSPQIVHLCAATTTFTIKILVTKNSQQSEGLTVIQ